MKEFTDIVLDRTLIVGNLYIEKFAHLDPGYHLLSSDELPEGHYGIYYRACIDTHNAGYFYLPDWSGAGGTDLPKLIEFISQNK